MFVFGPQYIPNTYLVCIDFVSSLYSMLGLYLCIGMYGMYSYVFVVIHSYLYVSCIGIYCIVFACIVCIGLYCKYVSVFVLVCIKMYSMYCMY